ncbi:tail fiber assembly protein [Lelliottia amnigena]|uniref:tail fiber assembly protein n=1 Tax=Lelliottia amnigena TaxID=61646 RepID=UPI00192CADAC|nr:tail fiber assembly protein [Lelliottia amnigena]MBL5920763.1 tail fiber assembly protein [Lelliottia amnigena]
MKPVFGEDGHATTPGDIRAYYFDHITGEYTGWSDEFINIGVSMPGSSTDIAPGEEVAGFAQVFTGQSWEGVEDHREKTVYSTSDRKASVVDYIGGIREGFTLAAPSTPYDKWNGKAWVKDVVALKAGQVADAEQQRRVLLAEADQITADWRTELALGIIDDGDKAKLTVWMKYIKAVKAVDTSTAPDINWPERPEV